MEPRTLVLAPWMAPNRIASWQQAICLVVLNKVDVLESYDADEHEPAASASWSVKIPAVVRIRNTIDMNKSSVKFSRSNVYQRDGYRCCYDGKRYSASELTYDHVLPRSRGGKTNWLGIVTSCRKCNAKKDNRTPAEAGMKMHFQPHIPAHLQLQPMLVLTSSAPKQWLPYLEASYTYRRASG